MFLMYHARSRPTGTAIAEALGAQHGIEPPMTLTYDHLIRWGNRGALNARGQVLNQAAAIKAASDKLGSLRKMREAGVRVPDFDTDPLALVGRVGWPILGRRRSHARATDVVLCLQRRDLRRSRDYYVEYIPTVREYRIHVVRDRVIRVQGKFLDVPELSVPHVRNHATGYRFRAPRRRLHSRRLEQATLAVQSLGLDFGAVDLLIGDDGESYVLEVNTAPACSPRTATCYVTAFAEIMGLPPEALNLDSLAALDPEQEEGDSDDEVEGEDADAE